MAVKSTNQPKLWYCASELVLLIDIPSRLYFALAEIEDIIAENQVEKNMENIVHIGVCIDCDVVLSIHN